MEIAREETAPETVRMRAVQFRMPSDVYEKLRHVSFYERQPVAHILRRLVIEYLEEKALEEPDFFIPHDL
ncbi:MAG: hypothetical protein ACOX8I_00545 [Bacillota bacterium]|jgi:predicted DNA-binding protein